MNIVQNNYTKISDFKYWLQTKIILISWEEHTF